MPWTRGGQTAENTTGLLDILDGNAQFGERSLLRAAAEIANPA